MWKEPVKSDLIVKRRFVETVIYEYCKEVVNCCLALKTIPIQKRSGWFMI